MDNNEYVSNTPEGDYQYFNSMLTYQWDVTDPVSTVQNQHEQMNPKNAESYWNKNTNEEVDNIKRDEESDHQSIESFRSFLNDDMNEQGKLTKINDISIIPCEDHKSFVISVPNNFKYFFIQFDGGIKRIPLIKTRKRSSFSHVEKEYIMRFYNDLKEHHSCSTKDIAKIIYQKLYTDPTTDSIILTTRELIKTRKQHRDVNTILTFLYNTKRK